MTTIEILVSPQGEATVSTKGFTGSTCREASRFVEEALGQRLQEHLTAEFHQTETATARQQQNY